MGDDGFPAGVWMTSGTTGRWVVGGGSKPDGVDDRLIEAIREEIAKSHARIMLDAKAQEITTEQIGEAMHKAFLAGIEWAIENIPEVADRLGYGVRPNKNDPYGAAAAFATVASGSRATRATGQVHWWQTGTTTAVDYTAIKGES